jgi:ABC-type multidrug transport system fused ATPase/permease subunit
MQHLGKSLSFRDAVRLVLRFTDRRTKSCLALVALFSVGVTFCELAYIYLFANLIVPSGHANSGQNSVEELIGSFSFSSVYIIGTFSCVYLIMRSCYQKLLYHTSASITSSFARKISESFFVLPYKEARSIDKRDIFETLTIRLRAISSNFVSPALFAIAAVLNIAAIMTFLLVTVGAIVFAPMVLILAFFVGITYLLKAKQITLGNRYETYTKQQTRFSSYMLTSYKVGIINGDSGGVVRNLEDAEKKLRSIDGDVQLYSSFPKILMDSLLLIAAAIAVSMTVSTSARNGLNQNISLIITLLLAAQRLSPSMGAIFASYSSFKGSNSTIRSVLELMDYLDIESTRYRELYLSQGDSGSHDARLISRIMESSKGFLLKNDKVADELSVIGLNSAAIILKKGISLIPGRHICLVGPSGCGKSTLLDSIAGLNMPESAVLSTVFGNIQLNKKTNLDAWRGNLSYIPQSSLVNDEISVLEYICGSNMDRVDWDYYNFLRISLNINHIISGTMKDISKKMTNTSLSGGEIQRMNIVRALYRRKPILILDEATNGLDTVLEDLIVSKLTTLFEGLTVIMVTHNEQNAKYFDKVVRIS